MPQSMQDLLDNLDWQMLINDTNKFQGSYVQVIQKAIKTLPDEQMVKGLSLLQTNQLFLNLTALKKYQTHLEVLFNNAYFDTTNMAIHYFPINV